jgi:hypothetical protein
VKRAEWFNWYEPSLIELTPQDVLAMDWEFQEEEVFITRAKFDEFCKRANRIPVRINPDFISTYTLGPSVEEFIQHLREEIFRDHE